MSNEEKLDQAIQVGLGRALGGTDFPSLGRRYEGKVRDNYTTADGRRYIVVTDRISAFDHVLGTIPFKGQVLNRLAAWWFEQTRSIADNHLLSVPDPNVLECVECEPLLVEMVVRAYITGSTGTSAWTHYQKGARVFAGHPLPEGLRKNQRLAAPILTPATKAPIGEHDVTMSREEILAQGKVTAEEFDTAAAMAMRLFEAGAKLAAARGLILADTKYEMGKTKDGRIVLIDEIHTPDSSRFWMADTYEERFARGEDPAPFDKDFVRHYYTGLGYNYDGPPPPLPDDVRAGAAKRYISAYERITGETFVPDTDEPIARIRKNLGL
ncbi:phosphoribosylaminoimidazolesuccinocarboxamide synthase [Pendulispora brunnea]|uniref:Phosphoribosylaminoimidazole-succinocarboxamide synthase n=1 Tax=Pendulispora brunnea TaxID=2905690 RepID=A0ABZ2K598_9BACT